MRGFRMSGSHGKCGAVELFRLVNLTRLVGALGLFHKRADLR